jgi:low molecular weight phosphotyrosine protein phosphatase
MAEAVFADIVYKQKLNEHIIKIDSFGTSNYHVGDKSDSRTIQTCKNHNVPINHRGQQIKPKHFDEFDYILCMDDSNLYNLQKIQPNNCTAKVAMFGEWKTDPKFDKIIDDPYYGGSNGFEMCYQQCIHFTQEFLRKELNIDINFDNI